MSKDLRRFLPREIALMMTVNGPSSSTSYQGKFIFNSSVNPDPEKKVILS